MTYTGSSFYGSWSVMNRAAVWKLVPTIPATGIAFPFLLLAAQAAPQSTALGFIGIDEAVKRFVTDRNETGHLFRAPVLAQEVSGYPKRGFQDSRCITRAFGTLTRQFLSLLGAIAFQTRVPVYLSTDRRAMPAQDLGYLKLVMSGFHQGVNLITFILAEVFVAHGNFDWGVKKL